MRRSGLYAPGAAVGPGGSGNDLSDTGLSAVVVDQFLIDLANTLVLNGWLNFAGNNAAHPLASNAAIVALRGGGMRLR